MSKSLFLLLCFIGLVFGRPHFIVPPPAGIIEFGVDADGCTVGPSGKVCPTGPVQFTEGATGVAKEVPPPAPRAHVQSPHHHHHQQQHQPPRVFTGLVGASGVIGPSGLVGPAGPVAFGK